MVKVSKIRQQSINALDAILKGESKVEILFEGEILIRTEPTAPLQIFCKIILNYSGLNGVNGLNMNGETDIGCWRQDCMFLLYLIIVKNI